MDQNKKELLSSLVLILFSAFFCFFSYQISLGSLRAPGTGFFPFYLGATLCLLSVMNFTRAVVQRKRAAGKAETLEAGINWKNIIIVLVALFSYPLLLDILGFLPVTFIFTACFLRFIEPQRWPVVLGLGAGVAVISYLIFQYWLKIQFPTGVLGI